MKRHRRGTETQLPNALGFDPRALELPVKVRLDARGRQRALFVVRRVGRYRAQRFNEMPQITLGRPKRVLATRFEQLEHGGFIRAVEGGRNYTRWGRTGKG